MPERTSAEAFLVCDTKPCQVAIPARAVLRVMRAAGEYEHRALDVMTAFGTNPAEPLALVRVLHVQCRSEVVLLRVHGALTLEQLPRADVLPLPQLLADAACFASVGVIAGQPRFLVLDLGHVQELARAHSQSAL